MSGIIDIVVNLYTPQEVELGQTGLDEEFKKQVRMPEKMRSGVTIPDYIKKMDQVESKFIKQWILRTKNNYFGINNGINTLLRAFDEKFKQVDCASHISLKRGERSYLSAVAARII